MSRSVRPFTAHPITTRVLEVLRVADVTPGMRRVTLGGAGLRAHSAPNGMPVAAFRSDGVDDEFKLLFRHPELAEAIGPTQADGVLDWPRDPRMLMRTYTARRWDAAAGELDVDFVVHGVGPATSWARRVRPGETIQLAGPKSSSAHPLDADWTLIAGDETALPAIARWLEHWPEGGRAQVFIEIGEAAHEQRLPVPPGVELTWLHRDGRPPGTTTLLLDALTAADWWPGSPFAWVAGESLTLAPIRRWLRDERGLSRERMEVTGYWRRQEVVVSAEDPELPDAEQTEDADERLHELVELLPPFAVRAAVTLGLPAALLDGPRTVVELAGLLGADLVGLRKLARYLVSLDLLRAVDDDAVELGDLGRGLADAEHLDLRERAARRELAAAAGLLDALRIGPEVAPSEDDDAVADERHVADEAGYVASAVAAAPLVQGHGGILVAGSGAAALAAALAAAQPGRDVRLLAAPSELAPIRLVHGALPGVALEPGSLLEPRREGAATVLLASALDQLADADAVHALRSAAASVTGHGVLLLVAEMLDEALADEHDYELDLQRWVLHGSGLRSEREHLDLVAAAGLRVREAATVGWGYRLLRLVPG